MCHLALPVVLWSDLTTPCAQAALSAGAGDIDDTALVVSDFQSLRGPHTYSHALLRIADGHPVRPLWPSSRDV